MSAGRCRRSHCRLMMVSGALRTNREPERLAAPRRRRHADSVLGLPGLLRGIETTPTAAVSATASRACEQAERCRMSYKETDYGPRDADLPQPR